MFGIKDLGTPHFKVVTQVLTSCNIAFSPNKISNSVCHACQLGKSQKLSFPSSSTVYLRLLELLVSDLWDPHQLFLKMVSDVMLPFLMPAHVLYGFISLKLNLAFTHPFFTSKPSRTSVKHQDPHFPFWLGWWISKFSSYFDKMGLFFSNLAAIPLNRMELSRENINT